MKILVSIASQDSEYLSRISDYISRYYEREMSIQTFDSVEGMFSARHSDVYVIDMTSSWETAPQLVAAPEGVKPLVLVEKSEVELYQNYPAIGKYQDVNNIYRKILWNFYKETQYEFLVAKSKDEAVESKFIFFTSASGIDRTTRKAVSYAKEQAEQRKAVLYLNLNKISDTSLYFHGDGSFSFRDVFYAVLEEKNIQMQLLNIIRKDSCGVDFIKEAETPRDLIEFGKKEEKLLMDEIKRMEKYDVIVVEKSDDVLSNLSDYLIRCDEMNLIDGESEYDQFRNDSLEKVIRQVAEEIGKSSGVIVRR